MYETTSCENDINQTNLEVKLKSLHTPISLLSLFSKVSVL